jgi:hypothetical protein
MDYLVNVLDNGIECICIILFVHGFFTNLWWTFGALFVYAGIPLRSLITDSK